jgi:hypothetical protein
MRHTAAWTAVKLDQVSGGALFVTGGTSLVLPDPGPWRASDRRRRASRGGVFLASWSEAPALFQAAMALWPERAAGCLQ